MFLLFRQYKRFKLTKTQLDKLADYSSNLSLFFLGSVLAPLFTGENKADIFITFIGFTLTSAFLGASMYFERRVET